MTEYSTFPDRPAFSAIGADVNIFSADGDSLAEFFIAFIKPYLFKRLIVQFSQLMFGILIKTAGNYHAVPGDYIGVP
jgi:hypothetical protein